MIRLTDEEMKVAYGARGEYGTMERVCKAQLKKVGEWLKERDRNNHMGFTEYGSDDLLIDGEDWQALLEETK